jgi:hypothetical protein
MASEIKDIAFEELDQVAGGRARRKSEHAEWQSILRSLKVRTQTLASQGKTAEIKALEHDYHEAYDDWCRDIANAPDNGPDIHFGDYFKL